MKTVEGNEIGFAPDWVRGLVDEKAVRPQPMVDLEWKRFVTEPVLRRQTCCHK